MSDFKAKMHQNPISAGASPQTPLGKLTALPGSSGWNEDYHKGDLLLRKGDGYMEWKERIGRGRQCEGRWREESGSEWTGPPCCIFKFSYPFHIHRLFRNAVTREQNGRLRETSMQSVLEISGNIFFNPIPSHSQSVIPIPSPKFSLVLFP